MHVISRKALQKFWERYPDSKSSLVRWHQIVERSEFSNYTGLRRTFPSADLVNRFIVFNIAGNKYQLITSVHFNRQKVYIRHVLAHAEYDRGDWKT
jgi:mRNA interferase HigB